VSLLAWCSAVASYYAIALNAAEFFPGDARVNFALSSIADVPSSVYVYLAADTLGRRGGLCLPLALLSAVCLTMAVTPSTWVWTITVLFFLGKFASSAGVNVAWLFTAELYPTNLR